MMIYGIFMFFIILYVLFFGEGSHMQLRELLLQTFWVLLTQKKKKKRHCGYEQLFSILKALILESVKPLSCYFTHKIHKSKFQPGCYIFLKTFATQLQWGSCLPFLIFFSSHFPLSPFLIGCLLFLSTFLLSLLSLTKQCLYYFIWQLYYFIELCKPVASCPDLN